MVNTKEIRKRMIDLDLTYAKLAVALNLAPTTVRHKIYNVRPLTLEEAYKMQQVLKIADSKFTTYFFDKSKVKEVDRV